MYSGSTFWESKPRPWGHHCLGVEAHVRHHLEKKLMCEKLFFFCQKKNKLPFSEWRKALFFCRKYLCPLLRGWEVDGKLDYAKKSEKRATGTKNNPNLKTQIILRKETKKLHVFGNFLRIYCNSFKKSLLNSCEIYFLQQVKEQCQSWRRKHKYF